MNVWAALLLTVLIAPSSVGAQVPAPSAERYYLAALEKMKHAQQPSSLSYVVTIDVQGGSVAFKKRDDGKLGGSFDLNEKAGKAHDRFDVKEAPAGTRYVATLSNGDVTESEAAAFNPTWYGFDDLIRRGYGTHPPATPAPDSHASPGVDEPHVIAVVSAFSLANYRASDAGAATCPNGDSAHAIALTAHGDPLMHPLTYAAIDQTTGLFCTLRFNVPQHLSAGAKAQSYLEMHLQEIDGYYLIQDERLESVVHVLGFQGPHMIATIAFSNFALEPARR